ncbi:hypothetical protein AGABI2DRAFT_122329 [Agaricus bisporus var. bisporus H97]|uniref:hypothetical protein n=1 Tax=Agaricus bisporus var. bisporus (strain H97 / ATCC MYA-4626 / FGSC 10389) TaxID=936046 RepID=UPI00029F698F|nr:hypothetical protein AGABI2DRAFT_122329 [Agaricus bisporus var. bisporus H97]EKV42746.1 hypothetical protein AGABI2DRAFT_122329 [Agaricus bisporus var. bisporus H97]
MKERVDVYWWRECTETHLVRCTLEIKDKATIVRDIPYPDATPSLTTQSTLQTDLFVVGSHNLLVFTDNMQRREAQFYALELGYSKVEEVGKVMLHATEVWSFRFGCKRHGREISRLYFDGANYRQIIVMCNGIYSLTIPTSSACKPSLAKISNFDLHHRVNDSQIYGLGFNKGYCRVRAELYRFGYSCGSTQGSFEYGVKISTKVGYVLDCVGSHPAFDEELGRLVVVSPNCLMLHDFSLPLYDLADVYPDSEDGIT